jgi:hypothetical protein
MSIELVKAGNLIINHGKLIMKTFSPHISDKRFLPFLPFLFFAFPTILGILLYYSTYLQLITESSPTYSSQSTLFTQYYGIDV